MTHLLHFAESKLGPTRGMFYVYCEHCRQVVWGESVADATNTMERMPCEARPKPKVTCVLCRRSVSDGAHNHLDLTERLHNE